VLGGVFRTVKADFFLRPDRYARHKNFGGIFNSGGFVFRGGEYAETGNFIAA
jgi:hypothetical protein